MAIIAIKDLPDSVELDRQAMTAIVGGAVRLASATGNKPNPSRRISARLFIHASTCSNRQIIVRHRHEQALTLYPVFFRAAS
jgi:hypothetical protein